jgi:uncharacterized membrane protein YeaQ/YmgE (transglycosylase-associated protein family)
VLTYLILIALTGLVTGALARLALPGKDPMSIPQTMLLGIAGSLLAGLVVYAITGGRSSAGFVLSVAVTTGLVYLVRRRRGGSLSDPGLSGRHAVRR